MSKRHGLSKSAEYIAYMHMKSRCCNKDNLSFKDYGGRGIKISSSWLESFLNFYKDMGPRPSKDHSIDRIDNNENYSKENCKWSTRKEQQNNRRLTYRMIEHHKNLHSIATKNRHKIYGNPLTRKSKICPRCKTLKKLVCFSKNRSSPDKYNTYCKQCFCKYQNKRRSNNEYVNRAKS